MKKLYIYLSLILATIAGFSPVLIGKFTDHGAGICDAKLYYSSNRVCEINLDSAVSLFIIYFIFIMIVMAVIYGIGFLYLSSKKKLNIVHNKSNQQRDRLTIIIFTVLTEIFCVFNLEKLGGFLLFFYTYIAIFLIIHLTLQIIASHNSTTTVMKLSITSNVLIILGLIICPGVSIDDTGILGFNPALELIGLEYQDWHVTVAFMITCAAGICSLFTFLLSRNKAA